MGQRFNGQVAVVTGAASGIGQGIAEAFAVEGATVALLDKNESGVQAACRSIEIAGGRARAFPVDVTDYQQVTDVRSTLLAEFDRIDILVNNAAFSIRAEFLQTTLEDWRRQIAVDLEAVYMGSKIFAEPMARRMSGRIITISSIQAFMTSGLLAAYNASKAGVIGLTHTMAIDLAPYNIIVNAIAPGFIKTAMSIRADGTDETETEEFKHYFIERRRIPLARPGLPEDVAQCALFLASDDCRYITGQTIVVDGGLSLTI